jgi:hypothetical protein
MQGFAQQNDRLTAWPSRAFQATFFVFAVGVTSLGSAQEQSLRIVSAAGGASGSTKLNQRLMPDGSKVIQLTMTLKGADGKSAVVHSESSYSRTGRPLRKIQRVSSGGTLTQQMTAVFGPKVVQVSIQTGSSKTTREVPYPQGSIEAKSEFWVIRDQVAPGAVAHYWWFDLANMEWKKTEAKAVGPSKTKVGGKDAEGFLIQTGAMRTWFGKAGRVLRLESPGLTMEAIP